MDPAASSEPQMSFRSGFVGLIGRPNVGKSTLLNRILNRKLAITSPKPQTTRGRILGLLNLPQAQIGFLDTPGLHRPEDMLSRLMHESAKDVLETADVLVLLIDSRKGLTREDERIVNLVRKQRKPVILALNKVDLTDKHKLLPLIDRAAKMECFHSIIPLSAKSGDQVDALIATIARVLPEGTALYDPEHETDQSAQDRIRELIREPILHATHQEVPHAAAVGIELIEEDATLMKIHATIIVERQGQKAIMIGKGGVVLKKVGQSARIEIESIVGKKVYLQLWVKVVKDWRSNQRALRELGYIR